MFYIGSNVKSFADRPKVKYYTLYIDSHGECDRLDDHIAWPETLKDRYDDGDDSYCLKIKQISIRNHSNLRNKANVKETRKQDPKKGIDMKKIRLNNSITNELKTKMFKYSVKKIKDHFGVNLELNLRPNTYKLFLKWLKKYDNNFKHHVVKSGTNYVLDDVDFIIQIDNYTFARIMTQSSIKNNLNEYDLNRHNLYIDESLVSIYVFGRNAYRVSKYLRETIVNNTEHFCYIVTTYNRSGDDSGSNKIYYKDIKSRSKDSVFLNDNIKDQLINHVQKFLDHRYLYEERNLSYKTGILLYGEPGTGKTTISNMLASTFGCDMVIINMSDFIGINISELTSNINADDKTYFVVLEDIDCVIGDRESKDDDLENKKNVNKLLQFLDSTSSPSNVVFIATTNHIDKLDNAILRDGRFDLILNITNLNRDAAIKMCKSFGLSDKITKRILDNNLSENKTINPAKLQNLILKEIDK